MDLKQLVIDKVNALGTSEAAIFFGKKESVVKTWLKKGNIAADAIQKAHDDHLASEKPPDQPAQPPQTAPVIGAQQILEQHDTVLKQIVAYFNSKVIPFFETEKKAFEDRFATAESNLKWLLTPQPVSNGSRTVGEIVSDSVGNPGASLTRPGAQTLATYAEPVDGGPARHPLDSGIAPSSEQVKQQAQNPIEGASPGSTPRLAGPAVADPNAQSVGSPGWTKAYPPRR